MILNIQQLKLYHFMLIPLLIVVVLQKVDCLDNGLTSLPPRGWRSWDHEEILTNQTMIENIAKILVGSKINKLGFQYVHLDQYWNIGRNQSTGSLIEDFQKYPNGIKALADFLHEKGVKLGLSAGAGTKTCSGMVGIQGHEQQDAQLFASWGIDAITFDYCYHQNSESSERFYKIMKAINETGRPMMIWIDYWGKSGKETYKHAGTIANGWRVHGKLQDKWKSVTRMIDKSVGLEYYAGDGGWNDLGTLMMGSTGMKQNEYAVQFYFWVMAKSPLYFGFTNTRISPTFQKLLSNKELLSIHSDSLGIQANRIQKQIREEGTVQSWGCNLTNQRYAIMFLNRGQKTAIIQVSVKDEIKQKYTNYSIRDVINHENLGFFTNDILSEELPAHSASVYILDIYHTTLYPEKIVPEIEPEPLTLPPPII